MPVITQIASAITAGHEMPTRNTPIKAATCVPQRMLRISIHCTQRPGGSGTDTASASISRILLDGFRHPFEYLLEQFPRRREVQAREALPCFPERHTVTQPHFRVLEEILVGSAR